MAFAATLKVLSAIGATTGILDVIIGPNFILDGFGAPRFPEGNPIIDSQYRFFGGVWAGYGIMLWWASNDVRARRTPLVILGGAMMLGGVGRLVSAWHDGVGSPVFMAFAGVELIGPPLLGLIAQQFYGIKKKN